jgi:hypothetical protein
MPTASNPRASASRLIISVSNISRSVWKKYCGAVQWFAHPGEHFGRISKRLFSKAAGESKPEAYPRGYVEDFDEPRTTLAAFFSILLA